MKNFFEKVDLQQVRRSAIAAQLLALKAQSRAIKSIGIEHADGLDLAENPEVDWLVHNTQDMSNVAIMLSKTATQQTGEQNASTLASLEATSRDIEAQVAKLDCRGHDIALARLQEAIDALFDGNPPAVDATKIPAESKLLEQRAHMSCYSAESEQYSTFGLQILAVCHLSMELAFNAVAATS